MAATYKSINEAIRKAGIPVTFYKGEGYLYFVADVDAPSEYQTIPSIMSNGLYGMSEKEVISHIETTKGQSW